MVGSNEGSQIHKKRILLVVPEYKTGLNSGGGVESVTQFVLGALADRTEWEVSVASLRMSRRANESRRLLAPNTWIRGPVTRPREVEGVKIHDVGASLAEVELTRYLPRRRLDSLAAESDVVMVISGSPAAACTMARAKRPVVLLTATLVALEREALNSGGPCPSTISV